MINGSLSFIFKPNLSSDVEIISSSLTNNLLCDDRVKVDVLLGYLSSSYRWIFLRQWSIFLQDKAQSMLRLSMKLANDEFPGGMCAELICRRYCYRDKETYFFEINQLSESSHEAISLCNAVKGNDISSYGHRDYVSIYANICAPVIWFKSVKTGILEFVSTLPNF